MDDQIINKVALSPLLTLDLASFYPQEEIELFDLRPLLFMNLILKEKDFRTALLEKDWSVYQDKIVAVTCTADAVIPVWAYMLIATNLQPYAREIIMGDKSEAIKQVLIKRIDAIDPNEYRDKKIVVKGCGDLEIGDFAFLEIAKKLRPVAQSIMYGEPCSTVPIYKRGK
jgi:Protein of unknown function (DUF2480)